MNAGSGNGGEPPTKIQKVMAGTEAPAADDSPTASTSTGQAPAPASNEAAVSAVPTDATEIHGSKMGQSEITAQCPAMASEDDIIIAELVASVTTALPDVSKSTPMAESASMVVAGHDVEALSESLSDQYSDVDHEMSTTDRSESLSVQYSDVDHEMSTTDIILEIDNLLETINSRRVSPTFTPSTEEASSPLASLLTTNYGDEPRADALQLCAKDRGSGSESLSNIRPQLAEGEVVGEAKQLSPAAPPARRPSAIYEDILLGEGEDESCEVDNQPRATAEALRKADSCFAETETEQKKSCSEVLPECEPDIKDSAPGDGNTASTLEDVAPSSAPATEPAACEATAPRDGNTASTLEDVAPSSAPATEPAACEATAPRDGNTGSILEDVAPSSAPAIEPAAPATEPEPSKACSSRKSINKKNVCPVAVGTTSMVLRSHKPPK